VNRKESGNRTDAEIQFHRIAQLQAQLDVALAELERIKGEGKPK
jgi:hypothetical protein